MIPTSSLVRFISVMKDLLMGSLLQTTIPGKMTSSMGKEISPVEIMTKVLRKPVTEVWTKNIAKLGDGTEFKYLNNYNIATYPIEPKITEAQNIFLLMWEFLFDR